ncbi:hypothetical protein ACQY0O_004946 [Thecaphora frezii]
MAAPPQPRHLLISTSLNEMSNTTLLVLSALSGRLYTTPLTTAAHVGPHLSVSFSSITPSFLPALASFPAFYPLSLLLLLLSHLIQLSLHIFFLLRSRRPSTTPSPSPPASSLPTARRWLLRLHLCTLIVVLVVLLLWRSKCSTLLVQLNALPPLASSPTHRVYAELGDGFKLGFALVLLNAAVTVLETKKTNKWSEQDEAEKRAYERIKMEWIAQLPNQTAPQVVVEAGMEPPAYPATQGTKREDGKDAEQGDAKVDESLSWKLVGDITGRVYN